MKLCDWLQLLSPASCTEIRVLTLLQLSLVCFLLPEALDHSIAYLSLLHNYPMKSMSCMCGISTEPLRTCYPQAVQFLTATKSRYDNMATSSATPVGVH
jgi:hypothetical protein